MSKENSNINQILDSAYKALKIKKFQDAKNFFKKAITIDDKIPEVHNNLGMVYINLNDYEQAINCFTNAIKLRPKFSVAFCNLGMAYSKTRNFQLAEENYKKSIFFDKKNIIAHFNLGNLYQDYNDLSNAEKNYKSVLKLKPDMLQAYKNLFFIYQRSNQSKKLKEIQGRAKSNLGNHFIVDFFQGVCDFENKSFQAVIKNFQKLKIDEKEVRVITIKNELLAKCYDFNGEYNKSFEYFVKANNSIFKIFKKKYKKENYLNLINKRIEFYSKFNIKKWNLNLSEQNDPIFLIGFPRSGTTLLDTILRTHNLIEVIEEKPIVEEFIDSLNIKTNNNFSNLEKIDKNFYDQMRNVYFKKRDKFVKFDKNKVYIDKLPLNLIFIGEICRFFPNAKFIFALRNPYDVILSCFMQQFAPNNAMMNFTNLDDATKLYDLSMSLYKKYYNLFKSNIHEIKYEDVVLDFDNTIKKLLKFLNLEWQEELKNFYETASKRGIISTPSYNQVSQPIYKKSINRWKNYENKFKDIEPKLNKWLDEFSY